MNSYPRPVLLGYIRADVLASTAEIRRVEAKLVTFAGREDFSLGTVYVERGTRAGVFDSLMDELAHDDSAWGLVVPDLRHLTIIEQLVMRRHDHGAQTKVVVASHCPDHRG
ncbi:MULTISPECIES: hypothetical protein [Nocardioides]|uniref:Resolvase/invertase-type recombinase catalytic domain-containing protein n=1 Tax=Nocardioides vastitatis TaxID=2568655 RepID=A0ABW0ZN68_9ACTN|nr:hypothetical protein [Nocardioides sp.]THI97264.1 hypothetical protein E7Z54_14925 [Nocardioides sp.]